jgi:Fe(3+) dicitrate transport protein
LPLLLAIAVASAAGVAQAADAPMVIHIQSQPLGAALSQLAQQASLQLFFSPELVAGKQAPAVDGNLSAEQALRATQGQWSGVPNFRRYRDPATHRQQRQHHAGQPGNRRH